MNEEHRQFVHTNRFQSMILPNTENVPTSRCDDTAEQNQ
jgi:hypothetical protein